jgi:hypothetical protein
MTTTDHNTVAAPTATLAPWHVFAADYRQGGASYEARITDDDKDGATHDQHKVLYEALLSYPVTTPHQLAEKAELILLDCWDDGRALGILAADALIVAHGVDGRRWRAVVATYEAARAAYDPTGPSAATEEETEALWRVYQAAWSALIAEPAPDAAASAYKIAAYIDLAHAELIDDSASNPATLARMLADTALPGSFAVVRFLQDAVRQSGQSHACLSHGVEA